MGDFTTAQWFFLPLWLICNLTVAVGILGLLAYMLLSQIGFFRVPVQEQKANTPGLPGDPRNHVS